jgi:hypothetical protein
MMLLIRTLCREMKLPLQHAQYNRGLDVGMRLYDVSCFFYAMAQCRSRIQTRQFYVWNDNF